jgi:hypothetical protein
VLGITSDVKKSVAIGRGFCATKKTKKNVVIKTILAMQYKLPNIKAKKKNKK